MQPDPGADPAGPRLNLDDIADMLGVGYDTVRGYASKSARGVKGGARFPLPDGYTVEHPHRRPYWHLRTIAEWVASRPSTRRATREIKAGRAAA